MLYTQSVIAQSALLKVKVIEQEYTGYYPKCDNCLPVSFWYSIKAEVEEVIAGDFEGNVISFGNLQHAKFVDEIVEEVYIILDEFSEPKLKEQLGLSYYANGFIFPKELVCIPNDLIDSIKDEITLKDALYINDSKQSYFIETTLEE